MDRPTDSYDRHLYAVTISPPLRISRRVRHYYDGDISYIRRQLNKVSKHYVMYPEYSLQGRLHYHGVVKLLDLIKWHKQVRRALHFNVGFVKLDKIKSFKDHLRWLTYCRKDWGTTREVLDIKKPTMYRRARRKKKRPTVICYTNWLDYAVDTVKDSEES